MTNKFRTFMREMRAYRESMNREFRKGENEKQKWNNSMYTAQYRDQQWEQIDGMTSRNMNAIREKTREKIMPIINEMRVMAETRTVKAPSPEIASSLTMLKMLTELDGSITPTQLQYYVNQMADCPLAMQVLQQIACKNNMALPTYNPDELPRSVDNLEFNADFYITGYNGNEEFCTPSVRMLDLYFQPEESFLHTDWYSSEGADERFAQYCGVPDVRMLESSTGGATVPEVKYFFSDLDGLLDFIHTQTANLTPADRDIKILEILDNCPSEYGANYRAYKADGIKRLINCENEGNDN